jgi:hypothetical protein
LLAGESLVDLVDPPGQVSTRAKAERTKKKRGARVPFSVGFGLTHPAAVC